VAELTLAVVGAETDRYAAVPTITFALSIEESTGAVVHAIALRTQIRIEPQRRRYGAAETDGLRDLFGEAGRWGDTLHPFLWTNVDTVVSGFTGRRDTDLAVTCTYDLEVAAGRYFHALADGEIPLVFLFGGTVFTRGEAGFAAEPVAWSLESRYRMPARLWRETMDRYFPGSAWLRLPRDVIDRLGRFKTERALPTWDQAVDALLKEAGGR
jgi:hypothetical protein